MERHNYEIIADEYYDNSHVTSRNFDIATYQFCKKREFVLPKEGLAVELGAGKGNANRYTKIEYRRIVQTDISISMLLLKPREECLLALKCDALKTPFMNNSFSIATAFLYDPYNKPLLYKEIYRILKRNGIFIGTLPHFTWGKTLRKCLGVKQNTTIFKRYRSESEEVTVELDSFLMDDDSLIKFINRSGLEIIELHDVYLPNKVRNISSHINIPAEALNLSPYSIPIVKFIMARKV